MKFKCKILVPENYGKTYEIEAEDADHAAIDCWFYHYHDSNDNLVIKRKLEDGFMDRLHFAKIDVDGEQIITRYISSGLFRAGGVEPFKWEYDKKLKQISNALGYDRDPKELLEEWLYEGEY